MFDVRFRSPSTCVISGPSQSGKTSLLQKILQHGPHIFQDPKCLDNIVFFYNQWQPIYSDIQKKFGGTFVNAVPTIESVTQLTQKYDKRGGSIVIIDDFMQQLTSDISTIFTTLSHHINLTVFLLTQNLFPKSSAWRDISLNSTYIMIFKNPRDSSQISLFARQYAPGKSKILTDIFSHATASPYTFLMFDNHQETPDPVRIRSNIFGEKSPVAVWTISSCI